MLETEQPLVSVITPTYNRLEYLQQALKTAIKQTYHNIEIIVSDNCSPENPQAIVESFGDSRIRFFRNDTNLGMLTNTINTFKRARGKYVASLLDDDMWEENFLAKLVPPLEANPHLAVAFCDHHIINAVGEIDPVETEKCTHFYQRYNLQPGVHQPFDKLALVDQAVSPAIAAVIRNAAINWDEFSTEIAGMWDLYLAYQSCRSGMGAYYCPERLTRYRVHAQTDTMLSGSRDAEAKIRKARAAIFCYERFMQDERLKEFLPYFRQQWLHAHTTMGIGLMRTNRVAEARPYFWSAINQQKFNLRTIAALLISFAPKQLASRI